jgi:hypothetical protein
VHDRPGIIPDVPHDSGKPPIGNGGWTNPPSVADWKPPGLSVMDRMVDAQDAIDRRDLERKLGGGR